MGDDKDKDEIKISRDEVNETKLIAKLEFKKKFNLGNYEDETLGVSIEGPYNIIKDGKDLIKLLLPTWVNMVVLTEKVQERVKPEEVAKLIKKEIQDKPLTLSATVTKKQDNDI